MSIRYKYCTRRQTKEQVKIKTPNILFFFERRCALWRVSCAYAQNDQDRSRLTTARERQTIRCKRWETETVILWALHHRFLHPINVQWASKVGGASSSQTNRDWEKMIYRSMRSRSARIVIVIIVDSFYTYVGLMAEFYMTLLILFWIKYFCFLRLLVIKWWSGLFFFFNFSHFLKQPSNRVLFYHTVPKYHFLSVTKNRHIYSQGWVHYF